MHKVILVLSDAVRYDTVVAGMGYLGHLVESRRARLPFTAPDGHGLSRRNIATMPSNRMCGWRRLSVNGLSATITRW